MKLQSLQDLFVKELKDIYNAEQQLVKGLPKMAKATSHPELQQAFTEHLEQTRGHVERLQQVFELMNMSARGVRCKGMEGLIEEGKEILEDGEDDSTLDAGLIASAQKVEHYEIASYGSMRTYAEMLGYHEAAQLLQQTLEEEKETDRKLSELAEGLVNRDASEGEYEEGEDGEMAERRAIRGNGSARGRRSANAPPARRGQAAKANAQRSRSGGSRSNQRGRSAPGASASRGRSRTQRSSRDSD